MISTSSPNSITSKKTLKLVIIIPAIYDAILNILFELNNLSVLEIKQELKRMSKNVLHKHIKLNYPLASLYKILNRMEKLGYLLGYKIPGFPPKKMVKIVESGILFLSDSRKVIGNSEIIIDYLPKKGQKGLISL